MLKYNLDIDRKLTVILQSIKKNKKKNFSEVQKIRGYADKNYDLVIDA